MNTPQNKFVQVWVLAAVTAFVSLTACEHPDSRPAQWATLHAAIIVPSCATSSCHSSLSKAAGVVLEDVDDAYYYLTTESQFVVSGDIASPLMFLLEADERPGMPPDAPLPEADVDWIRQWIAEGAER